MFGVLNIGKPPGSTSRDIVSRIQRQVRPAKVGHAGTLDPLATGVLLVVVGGATRLVPYAHQLGKKYLSTFQLGKRSSSDDIEEPAELLADAPIPTAEQIQAKIPLFVGDIDQRPPQYSAVKVGGKRAYALARAGHAIELTARSVRIDRIEIVSYCYPELRLEIECGSGTYIRSVGRDLAESLGTAAVMSALERTAIGEFLVADAWRLAGNTPIETADVERHLLPATSLVSRLPRTVVSPDEMKRLSTGQDIRRTQHGWSGEVAAVDAAGQLVAILVPRDIDTVRPFRNFPSTR